MIPLLPSSLFTGEKLSATRMNISAWDHHWPYQGSLFSFKDTARGDGEMAPWLRGSKLDSLHQQGSLKASVTGILGDLLASTDNARMWQSYPHIKHPHIKHPHIQSLKIVRVYLDTRIINTDRTIHTYVRYADYLVGWKGKEKRACTLLLNGHRDSCDLLSFSHSSCVLGSRESCCALSIGHCSLELRPASWWEAGLQATPIAFSQPSFSTSFWSTT